MVAAEILATGPEAFPKFGLLNNRKNIYTTSLTMIEIMFY